MAGISVAEELPTLKARMTDEQLAALADLERCWREAIEEREDNARNAMAGRRYKKFRRAADPNTGRPHPDTAAQKRQCEERAAGLQDDEDRVAEAVAARIVATPLALDKIDGGYALNFNELVISAYLEVCEVFRRQWSEDPDRGNAYADLVCSRILYPGHLTGPIERLLELKKQQDEQSGGDAEPATALTQKDVTQQPATLSLQLDKVYSYLDTFHYGALQKIRVSGEKEPELVVDVMLSTDEAFDGVATSRTLTTREKYVYGDIMSFWHAGIMQFDVITAWRSSTGQKRKPSQKELAEFDAIIEKLRHTEASINCTEELKKRSPGITGGEYKEILLNLGVLTVRYDNGTEMKAYKFLSEPVLHRHNREAGDQISGCSRGLIEACAAKRSVTENSYNIRMYLLTRVAYMKRKGSKVSKRIKLETVMDKTGMDKTSSSEKRNARIIIADYLDVFAEEKHIRGWKPVAGKRGVVEAYDIEVQQA